MALIILLFCYFGQAYSCVRTSSSGTTTLAPGVTAGTTLATGTTVTVPTTTTTESKRNKTQFLFPACFPSGMVVETGSGSLVQVHRSQQHGAVEACWAHNPEVRGSKPRAANLFCFFWKNSFLYSSSIFLSN